MSNIYAIKVDITVQKDIDELLKFIKNIMESTSGSFWCLVNNAGVQSGFYFDWNSLEPFKNCND